MVNAIKKMDKKFKITCLVIVGIPLFILLFLAIVQGCKNGASYEKYEKQMVEAAEKYFKQENLIPGSEGQKETVDLATLVNKKYIKSTEKYLDDLSCMGSISVIRNGASIEENDGGYLNYTYELTCDEYSTPLLINKIKEDLTTEGDGLYVNSEGYIYRGYKVENYIRFYGTMYRILSIDEDNNLKLLKVEPERNSRIWDNKFNVDSNYSSGKNIYKDSKILEYLINDYKNEKKFSQDVKKSIVAHDICVGKRSTTNLELSNTVECSEILEDQLISLLELTDFAKASLDENCNSIKAKSCKNYNYLKGTVTSTWTVNGVLDNTYEAYALLDGIAYAQTTNEYNTYQWVIYISGNETYTSGKGTLNDPYVIE